MVTRALCIIQQVLEPCGHDLGGLMDAAAGCFLCPCNRSEHHLIQGDDRVSAPETRQHMLYHALCQDTIHGLQLVADD
jgi:hypothetical protein